MIKIINIAENSPAFFAGISPNSFLIAINGHGISDVLDYKYYTAAKKVKIEYFTGLEDTPNAGKVLAVKIKKGEYEDLGLEFETYLMDEKRRCKNKCVFCFIDQLPPKNIFPNLRETLRFKDDDARLSFLQGNYITLTNMTDADAERVIKMKLPLNVSVHTTNPELRARMMGNRHAGESLRYLYDFANAGNALNCQIVLCKGLNDGDELTATLRDLNALKPAVESVAVVPVGLTKWRRADVRGDGVNLEPLEPFTKDDAAKIIAQISKFDKMYPADEFFLLAGQDIPPESFYNGYPQYENGVGMLRLLIEETRSELDNIKSEISNGEFFKTQQAVPKRISCVTGEAAYPTIKTLCGEIAEATGKITEVFAIKNEFFGGCVNVTGLVTATDIIAQLKNVPREAFGEYLLIPRNMLNSDELFLDNLTPADIENALKIETKILGIDGADLAKA